MNTHEGRLSLLKRETFVGFVVFLLTALFFISLSVFATTVGTNMDATGTVGAATSTPWGDLAVDQVAGKGNLRPVFAVGDNATATPAIFVSQKGVVSFGSSTPSNLLLNVGDVVIGRHGASSDLFVSGGLGVGNATTTDNNIELAGKLVATGNINGSGTLTITGTGTSTVLNGGFRIGSDIFTVYSNSNIGMFGTSSPILTDGLSLGGAAGTHASVYVSGGLGIGNATTTDNHFVIGSGLFTVYGNGTIGMFGTTSPILVDGLSLGGAAGTHADLYVSGGLGVGDATTTDSAFVVGTGLTVYGNGDVLIGATTSPYGFVVEKPRYSFSTGDTSTSTLGIYNEAAANGANSCIEMSSDGLIYRVMINGAGTGILVEAGYCNGD
ncbi:MAG: hypothetical protein G01um101470_126 [Parcubacteria group bacterium Gr01-1014_70]|nr:MAG: hypothetical protein G01um101470_126 [Parcubacteria group bacterium Gr01-1014_70]